MTVTPSKLTNKHRPAKTYKYSYFTTTSNIIKKNLPQDLATINNKQKFRNIQKIKKESPVIIIIIHAHTIPRSVIYHIYLHSSIAFNKLFGINLKERSVIQYRSSVFSKFLKKAIKNHHGEVPVVVQKKN